MKRTEEFCHTKSFYALLKILLIDPHHQAAGNLGMSLTINSSWPGTGNAVLMQFKDFLRFFAPVAKKILLKQKYFPARKSLFSAGGHKEIPIWDDQ
jgi:hypothetical protein